MDIRLPSLGEGADSGIVVNIMVKEGDQVQKDQPILELETEKAVGTIPSSAAGSVQKVRVKIGDKISAGQVILTLAETASAVALEPVVVAPVSGARRPKAAGTAATTPIPGIPPPASPSVRRMAAQLGIYLTRVRGSEHGGRITLDDVRGYIQQLQQSDAGVPAPAAKPVEERIDFSQWGPITKKPLSSLRKTIARRMSESWSTVPRVTQFDQADITGLDELRKKSGKLTLTPLAMRAVVATLKKHPMFNSSLDETAGEIVLKEYYHIGIAVDTEHGLLVPVIRDVDKKTVLVISKELEEVATKTRERKLTADQMKGGTFTISNQGG